MSETPSRKMTHGVTVLALTAGTASLRMWVCAPPSSGSQVCFLAPFMVSPQQSAGRVGRSYATSHDSVTRAEMREDSKIAGTMLTVVTVWWAGCGGSIRRHHSMCTEDLFTVRPCSPVGVWASGVFLQHSSPLPEYLLSYLLWQQSASGHRSLTALSRSLPACISGCIRG